MADVFISYKRDDRRWAERLADALAKHGLDVWWDHELEAGDAFRRVINAQMEQARAVLVLWSKASVESDFVLDEAGRGLARGILVPATIEPISPPLGFGQVHAIDLSGWNGDPNASSMRAIVSAVQRATEGSGASERRAPVRFGHLGWKTTALWALGLGICGGLAIGFEDLHRGEPMGAPGAFWLVHALAGATLIGGPVLLSRLLVSWAQQVAGGRARAFLDPAFLAVGAPAVCFGLFGYFTEKDEPVAIFFLVGAWAALIFAALGVAATAVWRAAARRVS